MSTSVLKALPGKLDIIRHSPSILYLQRDIWNDGETNVRKIIINRGSHMCAHVLLNLLNEFGKKRLNARLAEHFISFSQRV